MASQKVELFDIASRDSSACWSLNPWKTRLVLNFKKIPYKTTWLEYPDIAPKLKSLGLPPNPEAVGVPYTSPAILLPDGTPLMDSRKIVAELEKLHPSPSLHLDSPILPLVEALIPKAIMIPLRPVIMPKIPRNLLNEISATYFEETRAVRFGCPLSELEKRKPEEESWEEANPGLKELGEVLKKEGGPFFLGETVTYADFVVVGALQFLRRIEARLFERIVEIEPALGRLYDASKGWLERDTH